MRPLIPALATSVLAAAAVAWVPAPGQQSEAGAPGEAAPASPPAPAAIRASAAAAYIQFAPDQAAGAAPGAAAPKPGPPVLVGLAGEGRSRTAYIMDAGAPVRARIGDKVGKWRLTAIGPHGVTLRAGGASMQLALYGPRQPPVAPTPAAEPPAAMAAPAEAPAAAAAQPIRSHAPEPASAPAAAPTPRGRGAPRYWVGPPGSAPPGYIVLKPGQVPPQ